MYQKSSKSVQHVKEGSKASLLLLLLAIHCPCLCLR
jgi:hypothetical protein